MYVITGGAGFIGSNVAHTLDARDAGPLVIVDRLRDGDKWRNIAKRPLADIVHPDNVHAFLAENTRAIDGVVHMGAISATTERDSEKSCQVSPFISRPLDMVR